MPVKVGLRCDSSPAIGVGHLVRCLALADELLGRGCEVLLLGRVEGLPWLTREIVRRGVEVRPAPSEAPALADLARQEGLDAVVLDGYHLDPGSGRALRTAGVTVLAVADGSFGRDQDADLHLDQNLDAEQLGPHSDDGRPELLGLDYVLFRDDVLARRRLHIPATSSPPRVLVVFGGTDPFGGVEIVVPLLLATGGAVEVLAVCADPALAERLSLLTLGPGQRVTPLAPTPDLATIAVTCDVVVTAAGSSVWEFICLGVPIGIIEVVDNQRVGYVAALERGVVLGLGRLEDLRRNGVARRAAAATIRLLLEDVEGRNARALRAQALVDGRGRERVADRLLGLVDAAGRRPSRRPPGRLA